MQHSDDKLVQLTLGGDHDAFAILVEKYQSQIHALAWRKIGDYHIAEDITQEVFLTAYQKLATLIPGTDSQNGSMLSPITSASRGSEKKPLNRNSSR